jgi:hypothetical protein
MPKVLNEQQIAAFRRDGAIYPITLMTPEEADDYRRRFEALEASVDGEVQARFRVKAHLPFPWLAQLSRHPVMLDVVEDLLGPDIIVWGTSFFTKKANDTRFVSWHQDSTYYGLEPPESITVWIAFSDSTIDAGCLRYIPGSHLGAAILPHVETFDPANLLARGQTIEGIDASTARDMELRAGQCSIHHNKTIHGSNPNTTGEPRIGFTVHFTTPDVRQTQFEGATGTLVRGEDRYGHWTPDYEPECDMDPRGLEALDVAWERYRTAMKAPGQ